MEFVKLLDPDDLPAGYSFGCAFSPDGVYLAVAHGNLPFITIYKRNGDVFTKLSDPDDLPTSTCLGCAFSPDGNYLAIIFFSSPYITIYKRNGDVFTKLPDPDDLPPGSGQDCTFSPDGNYLVIAHQGSPYITIYKRNGDVFTKLSDPDDVPIRPSTGCSFSPNGNYLAVVTTGYPKNLIIYRRAGDVFTKLSDPDVLIYSDCQDCAFSPDGYYLVVAHLGFPNMTIYKRAGDIFTKLFNPDDLPSNGGRGCAFSPNRNYLAVAHYNSPHITTYKHSGDIFTKLPDPDVLPVYAVDCAFSPDGNYLTVVQESSPFITIYKSKQPPPPPKITGSITFRGRSSMSLSAVKTAVGKITFRGRAILRLIGLVLRELEGIYQISSSEIFSRSQPVLSEDLANHIEVWINPVAPATIAEELYRSNDPEEIPPNESKTFVIEYSKKPAANVSASLENQGVYLSISDEKYYSGSAEITITNSSAQLQTCTIVITGKPLETQGRRKIVVRDENSILDHGLVKYEFDSPLVQNEATAQNIGEKILRLFSIARANIEIEWRGDPMLELADIVKIPEFEKLGISKKENFYITRQEFKIGEGGMEVNMTGRKVPPNQ